MEFPEIENTMSNFCRFRYNSQSQLSKRIT